MQAIAFAENIRMDDMDCEYSLLKGQVMLENGFEEEAVKSFGEALRSRPSQRHTYADGHRCGLWRGRVLR